MNQKWRGFLVGEGADFAGDELVKFTTTASVAPGPGLENLLANLSYLGLLEVSGDDATSFLQNLLSNDINSINDTHNQLSSFCTAKGRMLAVFRVFKRDDSYFLRIPRELLDTVSKRLKMYVLMSKVKLQVMDDWVGLGLNGQLATEFLRNHLQLSLGDNNEVRLHNDLSILRVPGNDRYEIYAPIKAMQKLWVAAKQDLKPVPDRYWRLLDINNGIPNVYAATSEHFVPQMANLQYVDGISFKKGCYPGQEVVARMQYLGKLKRRMFRVRLDTNQVPRPGSAIVASDGDQLHEAGEILDAAPAGDTVMALAVLPVASTDKPLLLADTDGPQLELLDLPYTIGEPDH